ncbi:hypothetical protein [Actinomadura xylanilytica]|uniref:hypothetical protein n=1 Tax=Actinomadura xylanilytica TaxID=887459 RepID=UPI00255A7448|nr:hypothetical protein [Actinomadura xylanilytica]MDL4770949.1 hypothetical protein [Actinomadura xylanilytica]
MPDSTGSRNFFASIACASSLSGLDQDTDDVSRQNVLTSVIILTDRGRLPCDTQNVHE